MLFILARFQKDRFQKIIANKSRPFETASLVKHALPSKIRIQ